MQIKPRYRVGLLVGAETHEVVFQQLIKLGYIKSSLFSKFADPNGNNHITTEGHTFYLSKYPTGGAITTGDPALFLAMVSQWEDKDMHVGECWHHKATGEIFRVKEIKGANWLSEEGFSLPLILSEKTGAPELVAWFNEKKAKREGSRGETRMPDVTVRCFDDRKAAEELKKCPKIVRDYFKLTQEALVRQKDLTAKAIGKLRSATFEQLLKELPEHVCLLKHNGLWQAHDSRQGAPMLDYQEPDEAFTEFISRVINENKL